MFFQYLYNQFPGFRSSTPFILPESHWLFYALVHYTRQSRCNRCSTRRTDWLAATAQYYLQTILSRDKRFIADSAQQHTVKKNLEGRRQLVEINPPSQHYKYSGKAPNSPQARRVHPHRRGTWLQNCRQGNLRGPWYNSVIITVIRYGLPKGIPII